MSNRFNVKILKEELVDKHEIDKAKDYLTNQYFYKYKKDVFHYDDNIYQLYSVSEATELIPNDIICYKGKSVEFSARTYLKSTDFMANMYNVTIDFQKPTIFERDNRKYLNMAKAYNVDRNNNVSSESVKDELKMIYDHLFNIWCSKNEKLYEWILNCFIACSTICGRKF